MGEHTNLPRSFALKWLFLEATCAHFLLSFSINLLIDQSVNNLSIACVLRRGRANEIF